MRMIEGNRVVAWGVHLWMIWALTACGGQNDSVKTLDGSTVNQDQIADPEPVMHFDTLEHDFGTIIEGEKVLCYFDYRNTGGTDLIITSVEASCGCTTPGWNHKPLQPGGKDRLELMFDASGREGAQRKVVTIRSNASNRLVQLVVKANVLRGV